ncbi:hypothetical protein KJ763_00410 [Patescibacteria group bacterium]|nr:hypothetical protein [Patescibacteria group bacterium]
MIIKDKISKEDLEKLFEDFYVDMLKLVVDIEKEILSAGCEYHIDCAEDLTNHGSKVENLWGANLYKKNWGIDFVSLINIKPEKNNREIEVKDKEIRDKMEKIIKNLLCN